MTNGLCKSIFIFLLISLGIIPVQSRGIQDIEILSSSDSEFHFRVSIADQSSLDRIAQSDGSVAVTRTVQIGVPSGAEVELISATGSETQPLTLEDARIASNSLVSVSSPVSVRGRQVVSLQIAPVTAGGVYGEVEIKVAFIGGTAGGRSTSAISPAFDRIFKNSLANYESFKSWPVSSKTMPSLAQAVSGVFSDASDWYKISVEQTGVHVVTGTQLQQAGVSLTGLSSDAIRIFSGGGLPLAVMNDAERPEFEEISILVEDGGDGVFDAGDRLLFYGEAVDRWVHREGPVHVYTNNPYTESNVYWLTTTLSSGTPAMRVGLRDASPSGTADTTVTTVRHRVHSERDSLLFQEADGHIIDYYTWYWTNATVHSFFVPTPGAVVGDSAHVILRGRTGSPNYMELIVNGSAGLGKNCNSGTCTYYTEALIDGLNRIDLGLTSIGSTPPYFDFMEVSYNRYLMPENDHLDFVYDAGATGSRVEFKVLDNFVATPRIFDISDALHPVGLTGYDRSSGEIALEQTLAEGSVNAYYCTSDNYLLSPVSIESVAPMDLRVASAQTDLFVITTDQFVSTMSEWIDYREAQGYSIRTVTVDAIMDNFSFGLYDPTAIRDFLKYSYETYPSPAPSAVLFVGDASFDYMDRQKTGVPNLVPSYIHPLGSRDRSYSDDNYVYFGNYGVLDSDTSLIYVPDRGTDMLTARWPVSSAQEIDAIVAKVKHYESPANFGNWRTNMTLVADDEHSGERVDYSLHVLQSDTLEMLHIPELYTRNKIYLWEYPFVNREKPAVNNAIVDAMNEGSLLINYVGHGNPDVWSHEHVLQRSTDLPRLANFDRLPLVFAASCAIGFFDDPAREGMAEDFLAMSQGGAVSVVSATRLVYSSDNAALNRLTFDIMLFDNQITIAEALFAAKLERQHRGGGVFYPVANDRAYTVFGDPCLRLGTPVGEVEFTEYPDSLTALGRTRIAGYVVNGDGETLIEDGTLYVRVFDTDREKSYRMDNDVTVNYDVAGPTIFGGGATISGGHFDFEFITPLDVGYGGEGAKVSVYAVLDSTDAAGLIDGIIISDSIAATTDTVGPSISFNIGGRTNFVSGDVISPNEQLIITLEDSSGINLAGGLGHGISLEMDGRAENTLMLNDLFEYEQDDYTRGQLTYQLENLEPGTHSFKIKAWDNANNSSTVSLTAETVASGTLAINDLMNYPNPMKQETTFYFELTRSVQQFSLEIFTLSGKKIKSFNRFGLNADNYPNDSYTLTWDGRDADGDRVATGVYVYKATAVPGAGDDGIESFGKIVVIN